MCPNDQIKSKNRVENHGEVFTNEKQVNDMLSLVDHEAERLDSRFLEPACGTGNFLVEILKRKLDILKKSYKKSQHEFEKYSVIVIGSLYGIDLLEDNIEECRKRLLETFVEEYDTNFNKVNIEFVEVLRFILEKNIVCGDALTMKDTNGSPLIFSEWSMPFNDTRIKRKEYSFKDIFSPNLMWSFNADSDTGKRVILPNVFKDHPLVNYMELVKSEQN